MNIQQQDTLIAELIDLALELGANEMYVRKLIVVNGGDLREAIYRGWVKELQEDK